MLLQADEGSGGLFGVGKLKDKAEAQAEIGGEVKCFAKIFSFKKLIFLLKTVGCFAGNEKRAPSSAQTTFST